jgi:hypothetical protein
MPPASKSIPVESWPRALTKSGHSFEQEEVKREKLPYEIDGIVIKVDRTRCRKNLATRESAALGDRLQICCPRGHHAD